jgi:regulator of sigma E protease
MFGYDIFDILAFFLVLTPIVIVHELGHFIAAIRNNIKVEEFGIGLPPRATKLFERNGTIFSLNWIPLGGFVRPAGEDDPDVKGGLASAPKLARFTVLISGALANFLFAFLLFWLAFVTTEFPVIDENFVALRSIDDGSPAEIAGLQVNDVLLEVNGQAIDGDNQVLIDGVQSSPGEPVSLLVRRDGADFETTIVPEDADGRGRIGVGLGAFDTGEVTRYGIFAAAGRSVQQIWRIISVTVRVPFMLLQGTVSADEVGFVGPASISRGIRQSAETSFTTGNWELFLSFVAFINVALGFTNLLPIPALDGGRIMFVLYEAVVGRRVEPEREAIVHVVGMVLLLGLMVLIFVNDFANPYDFNFR